MARWVIAPLVVILLAAAACSGSGGEESTTTVAVDGITATTGGTDGSSSTSATTATTEAGTSTTTTTTTLAPPTDIPDYSIESRTAGTGGDTVVILLPAGTYSDVDLENIVVDVVDRFAPVVTVHVVDDTAAVPLVLEPEGTLAAAELTLLAQHYFVRLEEGFRLVYQGPFETVGEVILGS